MYKRYESFTLLISRIAKSVLKIKMEEMTSQGLKSSHVSCLYYLYKENKPLTATELSKLCEEDKAAISRTIDYLSKNNYIVCEKKFEKAYRSPLILTDKGIKIAKIINEKIENIVNVITNGLDQNEISIMYKFLTTISDNLDKFCLEQYRR